MRFHPRRHGAYNFSARAASAFTNAYFKNKKAKEKYRSQGYNNNSNYNADTQGKTIGCAVIAIFVLMFVVAAILSPKP